MDNAFDGVICEDLQSASWKVPQTYLDLLTHLYLTVSNFDYIEKGILTLVDSLWYKGQLTPALYETSKAKVSGSFSSLKQRVDLALEKGYFVEQNTRKRRCLTTVQALGDFINEIEYQRRATVDDLRVLTDTTCTPDTMTQKSLDKYCHGLPTTSKTGTKCIRPCVAKGNRCQRQSGTHTKQNTKKHLLNK